MPDIGFRLFGDSTSLERAITRGKASVDSLDKDLKGVNKVIGTLGKVGGAFGVVEMFSTAINKAQALRDEAKKNGTEISANVAALARYGDTLDGIKSSFAAVGAEALGFFAKAGEGWAGIYTYITQGAEGVKALKERSAQITSGEKNIADLERTRKVQKEINEEGRAYAMKALSDEEKKKMIVEEQSQLFKVMNDESKTHEERKKAELAIIKKQVEVEAIEAKQRKDLAEAEKSAADAKEKTRFDALSDEEKILDLRKQALDLEDQQHIVGLDRVEVLKLEAAEQEKIAQANALQKKLDEDRLRLAEQKKSSEKKVSGAQGALQQFKADRSSMSLQELASISPFAAGVSAEASNKASAAREILGLEAEANKRRKFGDAAGADEIFSRADQMRNALVDSGGVKSTEQSATAKLEEALKAELTELKEINAKFAGVAKPK